jgi:hypothetical protein
VDFISSGSAKYHAEVRHIWGTQRVNILNSKLEQFFISSRWGLLEKYQHNLQQLALRNIKYVLHISKAEISKSVKQITYLLTHLLTYAMEQSPS